MRVSQALQRPAATSALPAEVGPRAAAASSGAPAANLDELGDDAAVEPPPRPGPVRPRSAAAARGFL
eukprot:6205154-Lingulodinium_polyedra.AAC.1